jgi:site-specific recombinase XerD
MGRSEGMNAIDRYEQLQKKYLGMAKRRNLSLCTLRNYESVTDNLKDFLKRRVEQGIIVKEYVSFDDIEAWTYEMTESGSKPSTVKQKLVTIGQFFSFATKPYIPEDLRYEQSPVSPDFYPKVVAEQIPEIMTDEEIIRLWEYSRNYRSSEAGFARNYALVILMLTTGLRNKEVLDLRLSDVDFSENEIYVHNGKGRKDRIVDMPDICAAALENYLNSGVRPSYLPDDDYLFGTTAEHKFGNAQAGANSERWHRGTTAWLSQLVETHVKNQTGRDGVRSHDLRHLFARVTLNATGNLAELQGAMGHTSPVVTERYSGRLMQRRKRDSARAVLAARDKAAEHLRSINQARRDVIRLFA